MSPAPSVVFLRKILESCQNRDYPESRVQPYIEGIKKPQQSLAWYARSLISYLKLQLSGGMLAGQRNRSTLGMASSAFSTKWRRARFKVLGCKTTRPRRSSPFTSNFTPLSRSFFRPPFRGYNIYADGRSARCRSVFGAVLETRPRSSRRDSLDAWHWRPPPRDRSVSRMSCYSNSV